MQAQEKTVSGTISDVAGTSLPGTTVAIKGTTTGVSSDFDGKYTISVEENAVLTISYMGYVTQEISVQGKTIINVTLDADSGVYYALDDSDVIGDFLNNYGMSTIYNFTMTSGSEKISYRLNGGYSYEDGIMVTDNDSFSKFNLNSYVDADLTDNLKSRTNIMYRVSN